MKKYYVVLLADEDIVDEIMVVKHPRVTILKTEILTNSNYDELVIPYLKEKESL